MLKAIAFVSGAVFLASGYSVFASDVQIKSLKCTGANGLKIESSEEPNIVKSTLGVFKKDFELSSASVSVKKALNGQLYTQIPLAKVGAPNVVEYDLLLWTDLQAGDLKTVFGVVGNTVYGTAYPGGATFAAPVPLPVGFVPITAVSCEILATL